MEYRKIIRIIIFALFIMNLYAGPGNSVSYGVNEEYLLLKEVDNSVISDIHSLSYINNGDSVSVISIDTNFNYRFFHCEKYVTKECQVKIASGRYLTLYVSSTSTRSYWTFWKTKHVSVDMYFSYFDDPKLEIRKRCEYYLKQFESYLNSIGVIYKKRPW